MLSFFGVAVMRGQDDVYLSSYNFTTTNLPNVYTTAEALLQEDPPTYRLRVKFIANDYHAVNEYNNNGQQLEGVPGVGTWTVGLYWVLYDAYGVAYVSPMTYQTVTISTAPVTTALTISPAAATTFGQQVTFTGSATDVDNNLVGLQFYVNPNYAGWRWIANDEQLQSGSGSCTITIPTSATQDWPAGNYLATVRAWDSTGALDTNGDIIVPFTVKYDQAVAASDASVLAGSQFTPSYSNGAGTGPWQFVVEGRTNLPGTNGYHAGEGGTLLTDNTISASWTPPIAGRYTFWVRKLGDGTYNDSPLAGPYALAVPTCSISAGYTSIFSGDEVTLTVNASYARYVNIDQVSPNAGYYGNVSSGNEVPPSIAVPPILENWDLGSIQDFPEPRHLPLTLHTAPVAPNQSVVYTFLGAVWAGGPWYHSQPVSVTVNPVVAPSITSPASQTVTNGGSVSFSVTASGAPSPTLRWQRQPAAGGGFTDLDNVGSYSGVTTNTLTVSNCSSAMNGDQFRCKAVNRGGEAVSATPATLTVATSDPDNQNQLNIHQPL